MIDEKRREKKTRKKDAKKRREKKTRKKDARKKDAKKDSKKMTASVEAAHSRLNLKKKCNYFCLGGFNFFHFVQLYS